MNEEYVWDKSGKADAETARLEALFGEFRHRGGPPALPHRPYRWLGAAAMLIVTSGLSWWFVTRYSEGWRVAAVEGVPSIGGSPLSGESKLRVGQTLSTGAGRAELSVGRIGLIRVEPGTTLRLVESRPAEHRLALDRGKIAARIWAPPRLFFVNMPSAVAVDLGCAYTLEVDETGSGRIHVTMGWVGFDSGGLESLIPAGAACRTRRDSGPGVPYFLDASDALIATVDRWDLGARGVDDLRIILAEARARDGLTLWHLLTRVDASLRGVVFDRFAALVPPPPGVTRAGIERLDRPMIEAWWDSLGIDPMNWWKLWKGKWPPKTVR